MNDRLPAGRHGLSREFVARNQHERILAATVDVVAERGYDKTSVRQIVKRAGVSVRTFYEQFDGKDAAGLEALGTIIGHLRRSMTEAAERHAEPPHQIRAAIGEALHLFATEPEVARFTVVQAPIAGGEVAARFRAATDEFSTALKSALLDCSDGMSGSAADALVGGIVSVVAREIDANRSEQLEGMLDDLSDLVTLRLRAATT